MPYPYSCYQSVSEWMDVANKAQEEAEPIRSELDAVQGQLGSQGSCNTLIEQSVTSEHYRLH